MTTPDQTGLGMPQEASPAPGSGGGNGIAIVGLVLAIIALLTSMIPFAGFGLAVVALILSIMGSKKSATVGGAGKGAAVAGIVLSILALLAGGASTACGMMCGKMASDAQQAQVQLDAKAQAAGFDTFQQWMEKKPEEAIKAQAEATSNMLEGFGIDTSKLDKTIQEAAKRAQQAQGLPEGTPDEGDAPDDPAADVVPDE